MKNRCPGMDPSNWTFNDIKERPCPHCGTAIEFWKDDVKRKCPNCGKESFNPSLDNTCLSWCDKAAECIDSMDIEEWKKKVKGAASDGCRGDGKKA